VDQNNQPVPDAQVRIYNSTGKPVGFYKHAPDYYAATSSSANWSQSGSIVYFGNTTGVSAGDIYYAGNEYFNVTSVINYSAVQAARGYGDSRINPISGSSAADPSYSLSLNFYRANSTWVTNTTGDLPVLSLIPNASMRLGYVAGAAYSLMDFNIAQGPFRIEVNASGYQNATYYYQPTGPGAYSLTLMNATACEGECNATVVYINTASGSGTSDSYPAVKRVKQPTAPATNTNAGDFPAGVAAGIAIISLVVVSGFLVYQRTKRAG